MLTAEEAGGLPRTVDTGAVVGLPNRALIAVMVLTCARISAAFVRRYRIGTAFAAKLRGCSPSQCRRHIS